MKKIEQRHKGILFRGAALTLLLALLLAACSGRDKPDTVTGEESEEIREEVLFTEEEFEIPEFTPEPETAEEAVRILDGKENVQGKGNMSLTVRNNLDPSKPMIALTFDDGPSAYTMDLMELLEKYGFDYLICSVHLYFDHEERGMRFVSQSKDFTKYLSAYAAKYCAALESGLFLFGCHADLFRASYHPWDENARAAAKDIIQCAASLGIPLEINEAGLHKPVVNAPEGPRCPYSTDEFFSMARDAGLKIILSSDGHRPEHTARNTLGREMAARLKIKPAGCAIGPDEKLSII